MTGTSGERLNPVWVALIVLLALAIRLPLALVYDVAQTDSASYVTFARFLDSPGAFDAVPFRIANPLYSMVLWIFMRFPLDTALAARLGNVLLDCVNVVLAVRIGCRIAGARTGYLTGILYATWYCLVLDSVAIMSEPLFILLVLLNIDLLFRWSDRPGRLWGPLLIGLTAGLATLTRGNGMAILPIALVLMLAGWRGFRELPLRRRALFALFALGPFLFLWALPRAYMRYRGEEFPPSTIRPFADGTNIALEDREKVNYVLTEDGTERAFLAGLKGRTVLGMIRENPRRIAKKYLLNLRLTVNRVVPELFLPLVPLGLPLAFLGILLLVREGRRDTLWLIALHSAPWILLMPLLQVRPRHFYAVLPLWIVAVAIALRTGGEERPLFRRLRWAALGATVLASLAFVAYVGVVGRGIVNDSRIAGEWLRENTPEGTGYMARNSEVGIHAGNRRREFIPYESFERIREFAKRRNLEYLVVESMARSQRPHLAPLLEEPDGPDLPPGFELAALLPGRGRYPTLIFRIY